MSRKVLMCGNEACGEGAVLAGCTFYAGYPITPQNELTSYMSKRLGEVRGTFIQAESELAAINMVLGASVTGARAMTSSSSPGISLKQEGISYLAACELPAVIVNMQRGGPGLGNIAPSQSDYFQATKGGGHGDYKMIVLAPNCAQELLDFTYNAFELADKYRMPVFILGDGLLGQMMEPVTIPAIVDGRQSINKPWVLNGCKGREPRVIRSLMLKDGELEDFNKKLQEKYLKIKSVETKSESFYAKDDDILLVAYGSVARIAKAAMQRARKNSVRVGMVRPITLWPFPDQAIQDAIKTIKKVLVVEMSSGQMVEDVRLAVNGKVPVEFFGRMGGAIPTEEEILSRIEALS